MCCLEVVMLCCLSRESYERLLWHAVSFSAWRVSSFWQKPFPPIVLYLAICLCSWICCLGFITVLFYLLIYLTSHAASQYTSNTDVFLERDKLQVPAVIKSQVTAIIGRQIFHWVLSSVIGQIRVGRLVCKARYQCRLDLAVNKIGLKRLCPTEVRQVEAHRTQKHCNKKCF